MAIALLAVQELAAKSSSGFFWISDLSLRDPLFILPIVFGALFTLYVDLAFITKSKHRLVIWLVVLPIMIATGALLSAGADIYLIASAVLLLIQRMWVSGQFAAIKTTWHRIRLPSGIIALDDAPRLADKGNKVYRLSQMRAAGMPVPNGLLLTSDFLVTLKASSAQSRKRTLEQIWNWLGRERLAVRSSSSSEDGVNHSFAGVLNP